MRIPYDVYPNTNDYLVKPVFEITMRGYKQKSVILDDFKLQSKFRKYCEAYLKDNKLDFEKWTIQIDYDDEGYLNCSIINK